MTHYLAVATALALLGAVAARPAFAQTERSGGEAQKFMQQYQQLAAEKTALQGQLAQQKKALDQANADIAAVRKERDAYKARIDGSAAAAARSASSKAATEQSLEQYKTRMNELVARFRETAQNLKDSEGGRAKALNELAARNAAFDTCAERNVQLFEATEEVLDRYEHVGVFTKVSAVEPFTKITRTRIENLVDDYRARAEELRVKKRPAADAVQPAVK